MNEDFNLSYDAADAKFEAALARLRSGGKAPKLNSYERQLLEFCAGRNMIEYLREEFEKHPIKLNENGELIGPNPFHKEKENKKPYLYESEF